MAWSRSAQHRAAVLWKKYRTPVARSVSVRSSLRVTCQAQLPHSHGFTDSVRVTAPPTDSRALESWTFTCSRSTRGIDRGSAKVSKQASSALHRSTRSRGIRDPTILFCDCLRIRYSHNLQVIRARKLSDTNNCHFRFGTSAHRQGTTHDWDTYGRSHCPPAGDRALTSVSKGRKTRLTERSFPYLADNHCVKTQ